MRIKNCNVPANIFRDPFIKRFGLVQNDALDEPIIMYGCGRHTIAKIKNRKALTVIIWTGTDATRVKEFKPDLNRDNIFHISTSVYISKDLKDAGLSFVYIPIVVSDYPDLKPVPRGDSVFFYQGSVHHQDIYRLPMVKQVMKELPGVPLIVVSNNSHNWEELKKVYAKCFIGLRIIAHDGICHSAIEMGLMGIRTVSNHGLPHTIRYNTVDDIVRIIKEEQRTIGKIGYATADSVRKYIDIPDDWLYTEYYEKRKF